MEIAGGIRQERKFVCLTREELTGHGFRVMARTVLDEVLGFRPELIEHLLAHAVPDPLGRAYNRTTHLPERWVMMPAWADYLCNQTLDMATLTPLILPGGFLIGRSFIDALCFSRRMST